MLRGDGEVLICHNTKGRLTEVVVVAGAAALVVVVAGTALVVAVTGAALVVVVAGAALVVVVVTGDVTGALVAGLLGCVVVVVVVAGLLLEYVQIVPDRPVKKYPGGGDRHTTVFEVRVVFEQIV